MIRQGFQIFYRCCLLLLLFSNIPTSAEEIAVPDSKVQKFDSFSLNQAAKDARILMFQNPTAENLNAWGLAIAKDPAILQKLRSSRISREAMDEILLFLRGSDLSKIANEDANALIATFVALVRSLGIEFPLKVVERASNDPQISFANKMFITLQISETYRVLRAWEQTDSLLKKSSGLILSHKAEKGAYTDLLAKIRWLQDNPDIQHDYRWLFFYSSLYLALQQVTGPEKDVNLLGLYNRHLKCLTYLGLWNDAKRFASFMWSLEDPGLNLSILTEIFEAQFHSHLFLGERSALLMVDRYIERGSKLPEWTAEVQAIAELRKAQGFLHFDDVASAQKIVDRLSDSSISDKSVKVNLLGMQMHINTRLGKWPEALASTKSLLLLEPSNPNSITRSRLDIRALYIMAQISPDLSTEESLRLFKISQSFPAAREIFWALLPLSELAQVLYVQKQKAELKLLVEYTEKQFSHTAMEKYLPFFKAWIRLSELTGMPARRKNLELKKLESLLNSFRTTNPLFIKTLAEEVKKAQQPESKPKADS